MTLKLRLAAVTFALLVPALMLFRWNLGGVTPERFAPLTLPERIGDWTAIRDQTLDAETLAIIGPDAHLARLFQAPGRPPIWLFVGVYSGRGQSGKGAHDPEVCYPAQGWEIEHSKSATLLMKDGENLHAQQLRFSKGVEREAVLYWFQPSGRWPVSLGVEQLLRIADALAGRPQYAFVRLSSPFGSAARSDLSEFAIEIAPAIRDQIDRIGTTDPQRPDVDRVAHRSDDAS